MDEELSVMEPGSICNKPSRRQAKGVSRNKQLDTGTMLQYRTTEDLHTAHCTFPFASHSDSSFEGRLQWDLHSANKKNFKILLLEDFCDMQQGDRTPKAAWVVKIRWRL
jgi:hypothetical protein